MPNRTYGWQPDLPDFRDYAFAPSPARAALPASVDLRGQCPQVYDQGQLGSCTANAIAAALEFNELKAKQAGEFTPSRLFIYYNERAIEGTIKQDSGAMIRDGVKSVATVGYCPETLWPYSQVFTKKPSYACYTFAKSHKISVYSRIARNLSSMKGCLADGYPFVFGFTVYDSFESDAVAQTGVVPMPSKNESILGGHAVMACGYDDATSRFIVRNSWGDGWGQAGYFTMPYAYLLDGNLSDDFWTVR